MQNALVPWVEGVRHMLVTAWVLSVTPETWFRGQKEERQVMLLNCLDRGTGRRLKSTFDYLVGEDDKDLDLNGLADRTIVIGVDTIKPGGGGRIRVQGAIQRDSLAKPGASK